MSSKGSDSLHQIVERMCLSINLPYTLKVIHFWYLIFLTPPKISQSITGFRSLADGERVEFELTEDKKTGRKSAGNVTGPNGDFVQGAPRQDKFDSSNNRRF